MEPLPVPLIKPYPEVKKSESDYTNVKLIINPVSAASETTNKRWI